MIITLNYFQNEKIRKCVPTRSRICGCFFIYLPKSRSFLFICQNLDLFAKIPIIGLGPLPQKQLKKAWQQQLTADPDSVSLHDVLKPLSSMTSIIDGNTRGAFLQKLKPFIEEQTTKDKLTIVGWKKKT